MITHLDDGNQIDVAGARIHLRHTVHIGNGLRRLRNQIGLGVDQDDGIDHLCSSRISGLTHDASSTQPRQH